MKEYEAEAIKMARKILRRAKISKPVPTIRVKNVKAGRWSDKTDILTLPSWIWTDTTNDTWPDELQGKKYVRLRGYLEWYISHELAHYIKGKSGHGVDFQLILASLTPNFWHWEETYKPDSYAKAMKVWKPKRGTKYKSLFDLFDVSIGDVHD